MIKHILWLRLHHCAFSAIVRSNAIFKKMPLMIFVFLRSVIHEELPLFQAGRLSPC